MSRFLERRNIPEAGRQQKQLANRHEPLGFTPNDVEMKI